MSGIFGGGESAKSQKAQQAYTKKAVNDATGMIKTRRITEKLDKLAADLGSQGLKPVSYTGPGYGFNIGADGTVTGARTAEAQGWMDTVLSGAAADEGAFNQLLSQITPGFGRLTNARRNEIENAAQAAVGNLREQLSRRRVLGASFADDQLNSLRAMYDQMKEKAVAESMVQELEMTNKVINDRGAARSTAIGQALNQLQFEGDIGAKLTMATLAAQQDLTALQVDLAKLSATITAQGQIAQANTAAGLYNTTIGSFPEYANLAAQEAAAPGQLLGTIAGMVGGPMLGGLGAGAAGALGGALGGGTTFGSAMGNYLSAPSVTSLK